MLDLTNLCLRPDEIREQMKKLRTRLHNLRALLRLAKMRERAQKKQEREKHS